MRSSRHCLAWLRPQIRRCASAGRISESASAGDKLEGLREAMGRRLSAVAGIPSPPLEERVSERRPFVSKFICHNTSDSDELGARDDRRRLDAGCRDYWRGHPAGLLCQHPAKVLLQFGRSP